MDFSVIVLVAAFAVLGLGAYVFYRRRSGPLSPARRRCAQAMAKGSAPQAEARQEHASHEGQAELEVMAETEPEEAPPAQDNRLARCLDALYGEEPPKEEAVAAVETIAVASEVMSFVREKIHSLDRFSESYAFFRALNQPDIGVRKATEIVSKDLVFSSKILKTANSPYFRPKTTVTSIHNALTLLGLSCVISMYFRDHFKFTDTRDRAMLRYGRAVSEHAVLTGTCSAFVSQVIGPLERETAFTLGLLHDIGKFVMPDLYMKFCPNQAEDLSELLKKKPYQEMREAGVTHALVGGMASLQLGLPQPMDQVIALHHSLAALTPGAAGLSGIAPYLLAVFVANQLAKGMNEDVEPEEVVDPLPMAFRQHVPRGGLVKMLRSSAFQTEISKIKASAAVE